MLVCLWNRNIYVIYSTIGIRIIMISARYGTMYKYKYEMLNKEVLDINVVESDYIKSKFYHKNNNMLFN